MAYDTVQPTTLTSSTSITCVMEQVMQQSSEQALMQVPAPRRGRPMRLSPWHLGWAIVWHVLTVGGSQLELWRLIVLGFGRFAPLWLSDQAIYKRLAHSGLSTMQWLLGEVSLWVAKQGTEWQQETLCPFASDVLALDESTLDQVGRWLSGLRPLPKGDPRLLAGRLSCLLDVRRGCWRRVDLLPDARPHCSVWAPQMLAGLRPNTLLLFDLGYFDFEWLDTLTRAGHFWISRLRARTSYDLQHVLYQQEGYLEALVFLGAYRADRAAYAVRLVQVRYRGKWYQYLTNVLDPMMLSGAQVVQMYARRWDIELAFRLLKDHLHLNVLWSAKWEVIGCQILASLLVASVLILTQHELAAAAQVRPSEVSIDLLVRYVPRLLAAGLDPLVVLVAVGRQLGIIRPSTRGLLEVPQVAWHQILWPPVDLVLERPPRYAHKAAGNSRGKRAKTS